MSQAVHSWEDGSRDWDFAPEEDANHWGHDEGEVDYWGATREEAERCLFEFLVDLKQRQKPMSAKDACILAFWMHKAGAGGQIEELCVPPDRQSGAYSKKFDTCVGRPKDENFVYVSTPVQRRSSAGREVVPLPMRPPHDVFADEFRSNGQSLIGKLKEAELPKCYHDHPVVTLQGDAENPQPAFPCALYVDAVPFSREDSVLGVWMVCLLTMKRWLLVALRKSEACTCGCRSWCSLYPMFNMLSWSITAMSRGVFPNTGHDGGQLDTIRAAVAGQPMGFRVAILFCKADWAEIAHTLGFPTWATLDTPCPMCFCSLRNAYTTRGLSVLDFPWRKKTFADYERACEDSEIIVDPLSDVLWRKILASLTYTVRNDLVRSRTLAVDIPEAGLLKGDRLEPSCTVMDTGRGFSQANPRKCVFWRARPGQITHHRNPLFAQETGVTLERSLVVDYLHSQSLGVIKYFLAWLLWKLLDANAWAAQDTAAEARLETSVQRMKGELFKFYERESKSGRNHTRVQDLTSKMVGGSEDQPRLRLHGSEMNGILFFAGHLLQRYGHLLGASQAPSERAQRAFAQLHIIVGQYRVVVPDREAQRCMDLVRTGLRALEDLGVRPKPKFHAICHMIHDIRYKGSPTLWATWTDESLNRMLKQVCAGGHRQNWHERVLHTMNQTLDRVAERRARKSHAAASSGDV